LTTNVNYIETLCRAHVTTSFVQGQGHTALFKVKVIQLCSRWRSYSFVQGEGHN